MSQRYVDVSHEALIRGWPRLRQWLDEDRVGLRLHRRITEVAAEWQRFDRDDELLYRGTRLAQALEWRERNEPELNMLEREFLDASVALKRRLELQEEERKERDLDAAIAIAAEKRAREAASGAHVSLARYLHEAGDDAQALAHFAEALRLSQSNSTAAELASAMVIQSS